MKTSESIVNISKALLGIQNEFIVIKKQTSGQRNTYASYDQLIREAKPILTNAGLLLMQPVDHFSNEPTIETWLIHPESGEFFRSISMIKMMDVKNKQGQSTINEAQQIGGGISYQKRYALAAMLAWATGDYDFDQDVIDSITEQENSILTGVDSIMTIESLTQYYKSNTNKEIDKELVKACAQRKNEIVEALNNDNT